LPLCLLLVLGAVRCAGEEEQKKDEAALIAQQLPGYPLKTCVVSGDELGNMGPAVNYLHDGRLVRFCCRGCIAEFQKDPDKYLLKLDEAAARAKAGAHEAPQAARHAEDEGEQDGSPLALLGHSHVVLVHFPIALFLIAALGELLAAITKLAWLKGGSRFMLLAAAASGVVSAASGWAQAGSEHYSGALGSVLEWHRWAGTGSALLIGGCWLLREALERRPDWRAGLYAYPGLLALTALLVGLTGHLGGTLVHGVGFLF
jgi:uncharacterized membrane protein